MNVTIRESRPGDGEALGRIWLDNARYYVRLFPEDFVLPRSEGLVEWMEASLARPREPDRLHLVAAVEDTVAAFVYARLTEPGEHAQWQMLAPYRERRVHIEALGTADAFQRRGLATRLVEAVEAWARANGARTISATTYLESPTSVPFWEGRVGYRRRGVTLVKPLTQT